MKYKFHIFCDSAENTNIDILWLIIPDASNIFTRRKLSTLVIISYYRENFDIFTPLPIQLY
jgi:hypothetical protein